MLVSVSPFILGIDQIDRITIALIIAGTVMLLAAVLSIRHLQSL